MGDVGRGRVDIHPGDQEGQVKGVGELDRRDDPGVGSKPVRAVTASASDRRVRLHGAVGAGDEAREIPAGKQQRGGDEHHQDDCG